MDSQVEQIWNLSDGRKLRCHFSAHTRFPFVDLYTVEDGETLFQESHHVRVYASEFERLKTAIMDFTDYLLGGRRANNDYIKPSTMVKVDESIPTRLVNGEAFLIDCSRSYLWLLVRFQSQGTIRERPKTVMDKERYFPIRIAFHVVDLWLLVDVLKIINGFFVKTKETRKMILLEERLKGVNRILRGLSAGYLSAKKPESLPLNKPPLLYDYNNPAGAVLHSRDNKPGYVDFVKTFGATSFSMMNCNTVKPVLDHDLETDGSK